MKPLVSMREALTDPALLGDALPGPSWLPHRTFLLAIRGEELRPEELEVFRALTGRDESPREPVDEFWGIAGRRSGKTRMEGALAAYVGALCEHDYLAPGERGVIPILAASIYQAGRAFMHAKGILQASPKLSGLIEGETADTIRLATGIDIEVRPANFRTIRSITSPVILGDEVAFWLIEGTANPDGEVLNAARPALATSGGPLVVVSSPYARRGELWAAYKRDFGPAGDPRILVAKGASRVWNSTLPERVIQRAYDKDAAAAAAEYGGEFRSDVESLLGLEAVEAVTVANRIELPPVTGKRYVAFTDPSGGSADSFTLAIAHREGRKGVLDAVRETKPPFSPEAVVRDYCALLKSYGITTVRGDRYAGEWPRERFRVHGVTYELADQTASEYFRDLLPLVNGDRVELLQHERLRAQLVTLERRTSRTGRDSISHPPGGHDDIANAVAGVLCMSSVAKTSIAAAISDEILIRSATRAW